MIRLHCETRVCLSDYFFRFKQIDVISAVLAADLEMKLVEYFGV